MKLRGYMVMLILAAVILPVAVGVFATKSSCPVVDLCKSDQQLARMIAQLVSRELIEITRVFELGSRLFDMPRLRTREITGVLRMLYRQHLDVDIVVLLDNHDQAVVDPVYLRAEQITPGTETARRLPVDETDLGRFLRFLPIDKAREKGLALSGVYVNKKTNVIMFAGAVAVATKNQSQSWVLGFESALRQVRQTAMASLPDSNHTIFIVDGGGRLVAHPEGKRFLHRASMQNHPLVARFLQGARSGSMQWEESQERKFTGAIQWIDFADWAVVLQRPVEESRVVEGKVPIWAWVVWLVGAVFILANLLLLERKIKNIMVEMAQVKEDAERRANEVGRLKASVLETSKLSAIGELGAGVAHELNNPLGGIMGLTQLLLRKKSESDPDREFLNRVEQEAIRCKSITDNLLRFSEQQRVEYREPLRLERVAAMTVSLFARKLESQRINVVRNFAPNLPRIVGNEGQIQRVILDVFLNAETAMPDGGILTLTTQLDGEWVILEVKDTGKGIPQENLDRVFEPFFTTKDNWKGAGLGLSVVYQIIKDHGGEVTLTSQPGQGTVVTFRFPSERMTRSEDWTASTPLA